MLTDLFYREADGKISFSRQQASDFAKQVADDFNPLHDEESKRFCVPGDLLFAVMLAKYGITRHMRFVFSGMVSDGIELILPDESPQLCIADHKGKEYLTIEHTGDNSRDSNLIDELTHSYVTFSGHTFPHVLVPLLEQKGVMINPDRPMVMYQSMLIDLHQLDFQGVRLELDKGKTVLDVQGKRGNICLAFNLISNGNVVGRGEKHMLLSGLVPYDQQAMDKIISDYAQWKRNYGSRLDA